MTPNELRLGNYVRIKSNGEIVKVVSLTPQEVGYHYNAKNPICFHRKYSEIEPVLIYNHWRNIDCPELEWRDVWDDGKWYKYNIMGVFKSIRYLHELQNLHYALTGEELKIEL